MALDKKIYTARATLNQLKNLEGDLNDRQQKQLKIIRNIAIDTVAEKTSTSIYDSILQLTIRIQNEEEEIDNNTEKLIKTLDALKNFIIIKKRVENLEKLLENFDGNKFGDEYVKIREEIEWASFELFKMDAREKEIWKWRKVILAQVDVIQGTFDGKLKEKEDEQRIEVVRSGVHHKMEDEDYFQLEEKGLLEGIYETIGIEKEEIKQNDNLEEMCLKENDESMENGSDDLKKAENLIVIEEEEDIYEKFTNTKNVTSSNIILTDSKTDEESLQEIYKFYKEKEQLEKIKILLEENYSFTSK